MIIDIDLVQELRRHCPCYSLARSISHHNDLQLKKVLHDVILHPDYTHLRVRLKIPYYQFHLTLIHAFAYSLLQLFSKKCLILLSVFVTQ